MHGVFHHVWISSALPTETQQDVHFILLAPYCKSIHLCTWLNQCEYTCNCSCYCKHNYCECTFAPQDVFNSFFAATLMCILSLVAVSTYTVKGTLSGGVRIHTASLPGTFQTSVFKLIPSVWMTQTLWHNKFLTIPCLLVDRLWALWLQPLCLWMAISFSKKSHSTSQEPPQRPKKGG